MLCPARGASASASSLAANGHSFRRRPFPTLYSRHLFQTSSIMMSSGGNAVFGTTSHSITNFDSNSNNSGKHTSHGGDSLSFGNNCSLNNAHHNIHNSSNNGSDSFRRKTSGYTATTTVVNSSLPPNTVQRQEFHKYALFKAFGDAGGVGEGRCNSSVVSEAVSSSEQQHAGLSQTPQAGLPSRGGISGSDASTCNKEQQWWPVPSSATTAYYGVPTDNNGGGPPASVGMISVTPPAMSNALTTSTMSTPVGASVQQTVQFSGMATGADISTRPAVIMGAATHPDAGLGVCSSYLSPPLVHPVVHPVRIFFLFLFALRCHVCCRAKSD